MLSYLNEIFGTPTANVEDKAGKHKEGRGKSKEVGCSPALEAWYIQHW